MFNINGKVVAITGAGGILGSYISLELSKLGAKIAVMDLNTASADRVVKEVKAAGGEAIAVECNVLDKTSIQKAKDKIIQEYGRVDVLMNAAGGNSPKATNDDEQLGDTAKKTFFDIDKEGIDFVFDLNIVGTMLPTQIFAKDMEKGVVINFSSMNAYRPLTKISAYSAAKAAVTNFTQWAAVYFAKKGIRVVAIAPGFFLTNQNRFLLTDEKGELTQRGKSIMKHTPMGRFGEPKDLLGALVWLMSDEAQFVTGITVPIDGGFLAYSGV